MKRRRSESAAGIADFLYEVGHLKRVARSGWWLAGLAQPESVAEHSYRTAIIGYVLATLEGIDPLRTTVMCLFHDLFESRTNDLHLVSKKYLRLESTESRAYEGLLRVLPAPLSSRLRSIFESASSLSIERRVLKDADSLECLLQAREYESVGVKTARSWVRSSLRRIKGTWAKKLAQACMKTLPERWWQNILTGKSD